MRTLEVSRVDELSSLQKVASFATLVATYEKGTLYPLAFVLSAPADWPAGFLLILEPYETEAATVPNPIFHLTYVVPDTPRPAVPPPGSHTP